MSTNYRKVFERYYQASLLDGIDIHHIDRDHFNNEPSNLQAVTLEEHYNIHKSQNDYYACFMISQRMKIKPDDWTEMAKKNGLAQAKENIKNGVGLIHWAKNNPDKAKKACQKGGHIGGKIASEQKLGIHALTTEEKISIASMGGKKAAELGLGFRAGHASEAGRVGGKKGGQWAKNNLSGIFALTSDQIKAKNQKAAITKLINSGRERKYDHHN
jgi:hypothetical protein